MDQACSVVKFYVLATKLKDVVRSGWKNWRVKRERIESVAEHVYGVQMLAIAMWSQYDYRVDIFRVIMMLAVHELEEVIIGDLTAWDITPDDKKAKGHAAVRELLNDFLRAEDINALILEFDERQTPEAKFAYQCDKLECDIQSCIYDREGCVDLNDQQENKIMSDPLVRGLLAEGYSWSETWCEYGLLNYNYDDNFREVSYYASSPQFRREQNN